MTDDDILALLAGSEEDAELTTPELAARLGISKPATYKRLTDLYGRDLLEKHPSRGLRSEAWSLSEAGRAALASGEGAVAEDADE